MIKLTKRQLEIMNEAGIVISSTDKYDYPAEDEERLADLLMNSLAPGQEWTAKAQEIQNLLNYLAEEV